MYLGVWTEEKCLQSSKQSSQSHGTTFPMEVWVGTWPSWPIRAPYLRNLLVGIDQEGPIRIQKYVEILCRDSGGKDLPSQIKGALRHKILSHWEPFWRDYHEGRSFLRIKWIQRKPELSDESREEKLMIPLEHLCSLPFPTWASACPLFLKPVWSGSIILQRRTTGNFYQKHLREL